MRRVILVALLLLLGPVVAGCGTFNLVSNRTRTIDDALAGKDGGTVATYPVRPRRARSIAEEVLRAEGTVAIGGRPDGDVLTAEFEPSWPVARSFIAVWFEPERDGTRVTCVTRRWQTNSMFVTLTESGFHSAFRERVEQDDD